MRGLEVAFAILLSLSAAAATAGDDLRARLLAIPLSPQLGGDGTRPAADAKAFSYPAANIEKRHMRPFSFGNRLFNTNWVEAPASVKSFDGLGPMFNRVSCSGCHTLDGRGEPPAGGQGPMNQMLLRLSLPGVAEHGGPLPHPVYGDQLSERAIGGVAAEGVAAISYEEIAGSYGDGETYMLRRPTYRINNMGYGALPGDILISPRVAPQMIGLGLLEAVPEETLQALNDPADSDGDGISGRVNSVWSVARGRLVTGRFGWKANQPDLEQQNAGAALGDIGLTTPLLPAENCTAVQALCMHAVSGGDHELSDEFLQKLTLYTRLLAVPAQRDGDDETVQRGAAVFRTLGCASCHVPTLVTGESAEVPELSRQIVHPFTDLLLHDMGEGLADGRPDFLASGSEWRTPPLWGLGLVPQINGHDLLLHDGRARGYAEAILWHGGEALTAREAFRLSSADERAALIAFLKSL
jgi:CxxC motif-containing protein (DUF1111 family)